MNAHLDDRAVQHFATELEATPPRPHHAGLLQAAARSFPGHAFRLALSRGGWYRPGGVLQANGQRVASDLEAWAEAQLAELGGDFDALFERHGGADLVATRVSGRTHFFVAPYGPAPADFLQLEVDELHEVIDRRLFGDAPPADLQELVDPVARTALEAHPVAPPYYRFRRLLDMRHVVARLPATADELHPLARFLVEWTHSQARASQHFCEHWVIDLRAQHDRYGNALLPASPVSLRARALKPFPWNAAVRGADAATQLKAFDRAAGYPGAWYFHLVAGGLTPRDIAGALAEDLDADYRYVREPDATLLREWLREPYVA